ncbi:MAG: preprotein translocase subunit SecG [Candidatus Tectimicrobiota bacterium]
MPAWRPVRSRRFFCRGGSRVLFALLVIVHIIACLSLILVVLLQVGKGQSIGAAFGGGGSSQTLFGSRGPATFLSHLTTGAAAVFMLTSLLLAYASMNAGQGSSITDKAPPPLTEPAPSVSPAPPAPTDSVPAVTEPAPSSGSAPTPAPAQSTPAESSETPRQGQ